jgi:hypothetical protein
MAKPCEDYFETHFLKVYEDGKEVQDLMQVFETETFYSD